MFFVRSKIPVDHVSLMPFLDWSRATNHLTDDDSAAHFNVMGHCFECGVFDYELACDD